MKKFEPIASQAVRLMRDNIDTDQIIPARFLKVTTADGLSSGLFADWRSDPAFVLNQPAASKARVLVAGHNFGCGSSREHAVWALMDFGFQAVISTGFADIFRQNALRNGLLPIVVKAPIDAPNEAVFRIDLANQSLAVDGWESVRFEIDPFSKICFLQGVDELGYIIANQHAISSYEDRR